MEKKDTFSKGQHFLQTAGHCNFNQTLSEQAYTGDLFRTIFSRGLILNLCTGNSMLTRYIK